MVRIDSKISIRTENDDKKMGGGNMKPLFRLSFCTIVALNVHADLINSHCTPATNCTIDTSLTTPLTNTKDNNVKLTLTSTGSLKNNTVGENYVGVTNQGNLDLEVQKGGQIDFFIALRSKNSDNVTWKIQNYGSINGNGNNTNVSWGFRFNNSSGSIDIHNHKGATISGRDYGVNIDLEDGKKASLKFNNEGTVKSTGVDDGVFLGGGIDVSEFYNYGDIEGKNGMWISQRGNTQQNKNAVSITKFVNEGKISGQKEHGVGISQSVKIQSFINKGTIETKSNTNTHNAIRVGGGAVIETLSIEGPNAVLTSPQGYGIFNQAGAKIENLNISGGAKVYGKGIKNEKNSGGNTSGTITKMGISDSEVKGIENEGTIAQPINIKNSKITGDIKNSGSMNGLTLDSSSVQSLINDTGGTISGDVVLKNSSVLNTFKNSSTISGGVKVDESSTLVNFENSSTITGDILLNKNTQNFKNSGKISGKVALSDELNNFENDDSGTVRLYNPKSIHTVTNNKGTLEYSGDGIITTTLSNAKGATIQGGDIYLLGRAMDFKNEGTIKNKVFLMPGSDLKTFSNTSMNSLHYLTNYGTMPLNNTGRLVEYVNAKGGVITSFSNSNTGIIEHFYNYGIVKGALSNSGTGTVTLSNKGLVLPQNKIHIQNDGGEIKISDWYIPSRHRIPLSVHQNIHGLSDSDSRLILAGNKANSVKLDNANLYIDAQWYDFNVYYKVKDAILKYSNGNFIQTSFKPSNVQDISNNRAFNVSYNPNTQEFIIRAIIKALAGNVLVEALVNHHQRSAFFIQSLVSQSTDDFFFLPFFSNENISLSSRDAKFTSHSKGFLLGQNKVLENFNFKAFMGISSSSMDLNFLDSQELIHVGSDSLFVGLNAHAVLDENEFFTTVLNASFLSHLSKADLAYNQEFNVDKDRDNFYYAHANVELLQVIGEEEKNFRFGPGLEYDFNVIGNFDLPLHYRANESHLVHLKALMGFDYALSRAVKIYADLGAKILMDSSVAISFKDEYAYFFLPKTSSFIHLGLDTKLSNQFSLKLNYQGFYAKNGESHNGVFGFEYKW